ncbi:hypothetical protein CRYUN_Cryun32bG0047400 [Craigia yunnanensis]
MQYSNGRSVSNIPESDYHDPEKLKRAAILVCIFRGNNDDLRVILTKRSSNLSIHSGEVALPGGKIEETDADDVETALREAKEEIGLDPSLVNVVTVPEPIFTKVHHYVQMKWKQYLMLLRKDENQWAEEKEYMGDKYLFQYFDYEAENKKFVIWALTAGILIKVASIVYQRPPAFMDLRPKFWDMAISRDILSCEFIAFPWFHMEPSL